MDKKDKLQLSETDIRALFITPAINAAGWDPQTQIRREVTLTPGPIIVRGNISSRNKKKKKFADYILHWTLGTPIGVVEAKENNHTVSSGMQQALGYAEILNVPSAFSSNGDAFASHNKVAAAGEDIETEIAMDEFPAPHELWTRYKKFRDIEDEHSGLVLEPYYFDSSGKEPRYYQTEAINRTIEGVAKGKDRLLLVMATGTGKTYTAFQIIYRLWKSHRAKRILFIADRNILVDQTLVNDFKPFGAAMSKIKNRKIDPSYEIHLGLYQALTGQEESSKAYKTVSPDFFDLIVIDECHRGSAKDNSEWREILDYFSSAIQLGLTATPKETTDVSNSTYFGEPLYTYTLKEGIEDGFLAPYKVIKIDIDKDVEGWRPPPGMKDDLGEEIEDRIYNQVDMDKILVLNKRTKLVARTVMQFLNETDHFSKTIIFCEDIDHAERMRKAIVNEAGSLAVKNPKYVMRITGDSVEGKVELDSFIDPESRFPVIVTTSEMLSTGVDAKTCKLIVLDKTISSMTIFKQIIGRGTRVDEEHNKWFFTIMDFKKATELFRDEAFDGKPVVIYEPTGDESPVPPNRQPGEIGEDAQEEFIPQDGRKIRVGNLDAKIIARRIEYYGPEGTLITESYRDYARKKITDEYQSLDNFLRTWSDADKKTVLIEELEEHGIILENLAEEVGKDYGDFDLLAHIAYDAPPLTRKERADNVKKRHYFAKYGDKARAVLEALLDKYADQGIQSLEDTKILKFDPFSEIGTPIEIIRDTFGGKSGYEDAIRDLEKQIYKQG